MHDDIAIIRHLESRIRRMPVRAAAREINALRHLDIADLADTLRRRLRRTTLIIDSSGLHLKPLRRPRWPS